MRRLLAPHSTVTENRTRQVDAALVTCDAMVSFAHDPGNISSMFGDVPPSSSELLWSRDGLAWEHRDLPTTTGIYTTFDDVAWGIGVWVAVGGYAGVIVSAKGADASSWQQVFHNSDAFTAVAFGAGKFVAVTQHGIAVSGDGTSWHWAALPSVQALYFDVAFGGDRFVVAGVGAALSSTDGETWVEASCSMCKPLVLPPPPVAPTPVGAMAAPPVPNQVIDAIMLQEIHYSGDAFFGSGASGMLTSRDGIHFAPFAGMRVPDAAIGDTLLSGEHISTDNDMSWTPLTTEPDVSSADCTTHLCIAAESGLLVFD